MKAILGVALLVLMFSLSIPVARADGTKDSDELKALKDELTNINHELKTIHRRIKVDQHELDDLVRGNPILDPTHPELDSTCDCAPSASGGCTGTFWINVMNIPVKDFDGGNDGSHGCLVIYHRFENHLKDVPASCRAQLVGVPHTARLGCGLVNRAIQAKALKNSIQENEERLGELLDDRKDHLEQINEFQFERVGPPKPMPEYIFDPTGAPPTQQGAGGAQGTAPPLKKQ